MPRHRAYNPRVPETHDLPDDVADLKRLVREHRLEIEFPSGTRVRIWGGLGTERLQAILRELSGPC